MKRRSYYIDFETGSLVNGIGGTLMTQPSLVMGTKPSIDFMFVTFPNSVLTTVDLSDATSWKAAVDVDLDVNTDPMTVSTSGDVVTSGTASGIVGFTFDCTQSGFIDKVNGKDSTQAWMELYGLDLSGDVIYVYRFHVNCRGTVQLQNGDTPTPPTPTYVYNGTGFTGDYAIMNGGYEDSGATCNGQPVYINSNRMQALV